MLCPRAQRVQLELGACLRLGERRAAAARDYLLAQGVDPARIKVISYGKERPAMAGSNEESWAKNRRAATVLN